ncbi:MAG TPA: NADP-dependent oxidoreductase [Syntrophobacteria bacterium]|nr:NADP-dependent oxidoreductase [Syntrophobacteria bacterium]
MKAIAIREFGRRDKLGRMDLPVPEVGAGEVLVRVKGAGVNPVDWKIREGRLKDLFPHRFPLIPGWDAAGIVEKIGPGVTRFRVGDEVFAYCRKPVVQGGAYAEYIALTEEHMAVKPRNTTFTEAAGIPLAALTAYQALVDAAGVRSGERVLIHAAAGGVGGFGVQIAKDRGALVWGTAGSRNEDYVRSLGAERVIDYGRDDFRKVVRSAYPDGVDVVFDCVGGDVLKKSVEIVRKGGRLISIVDSLDEGSQGRADIRFEFVFVAPNSKELSELGQMVEQGRLRVHLEEVLPLEAAAKAHELSESRHTRGKIVLSV